MSNVKLVPVYTQGILCGPLGVPQAITVTVRSCIFLPPEVGTASDSQALPSFHNYRNFTGRLAFLGA